MPVKFNLTPGTDRRSFLKTVAGGAAAVSLASLAPALATATAATAPVPGALAAQKLSDSLMLFSGAGANVVSCRDSAGVALVDGGLQAHSRDLLELVRAQTGADKIHTLYNTHWHPQQTGSNIALGDAGARIIAHENTRLWLQYANAVPPGGELYGPLPPKARPSQTFFYDSVKTQIADEPVQYGYLMQAHTDGDIYVYFRKSNVLVAGGPVSNEGWPVIDYRTGGWIVGLVDGIRTLAGLADDDTRIVPANGPVMRKADLVAQQQMYGTIAGRLQRMLRKSLGPDEVIAQKPAAEYEAKWGDSRVFVGMAFRSLWGHMAPDS